MYSIKTLIHALVIMTGTALPSVLAAHPGHEHTVNELTTPAHTALGVDPLVALVLAGIALFGLVVYLRE